MTQHIVELAAAEVAAKLHNGSITLVDVREAAEYGMERIDGAHLFPLSTFDPATLPMDPQRPVVFYCGSGKRSAMAVQRCAAAGVALSTHLHGGIAAWKVAGLPTVTLNATTGKLSEPGAKQG
jgi:rhodanese-related sulfurtransferase